MGHRPAAPGAPGEVRDRPPWLRLYGRARDSRGSAAACCSDDAVESRAAALPLLTFQSSAEDSPAFLSVLMPHCLDSCALRNRSSGRDLTMDAHRRAAVGIRRRETSCRSPLTRERRCARSNLPIARSRNQESVRTAQLIRGRCPLAAALPRRAPRGDDRRGCAGCFLPCRASRLRPGGRGGGG